MRRFPPREDLFLVFSACIFLIHVWAYLAMLEVIPAWILRMDLADMVATIAYVLVFAFFESVIIWLVLIIFAWVMPVAWLRGHFVSSGTTLLLGLGFWFIAFNLYFTNFLSQQALNKTIIIIVAVATSLTLSFIASRTQKMESVFRSFLRHIVVLSSVYILMDLIAFFLVIIRNFRG